MERIVPHGIEGFSREISMRPRGGVSSRRLRGMSGANLLILDHGEEDDRAKLEYSWPRMAINNTRDWFCIYPRVYNRTTGLYATTWNASSPRVARFRC